jgi:hypothetical protein
VIRTFRDATCESQQHAISNAKGLDTEMLGLAKWLNCSLFRDSAKLLRLPLKLANYLLGLELDVNQKYL